MALDRVHGVGIHDSLFLGGDFLVWFARIRDRLGFLNREKPEFLGNAGLYVVTFLHEWRTGLKERLHRVVAFQWRPYEDSLIGR